MTTFFFTFGLLSLVILGMSLGVIFAGKTIKGSCGGLNAIADADKCVVCSREIDPNSPLKERIGPCPRAKRMAEAMNEDL